MFPLRFNPLKMLKYFRIFSAESPGPIFKRPCEKRGLFYARSGCFRFASTLSKMLKYFRIFSAESPGPYISKDSSTGVFFNIVPIGMQSLSWILLHKNKPLFCICFYTYFFISLFFIILNNFKQGQPPNFSYIYMQGQFHFKPYRSMRDMM